MKAVGLKVLKNKLSEYVRLAASGETVLVTDRDQVVAELVPPRAGRAESVDDAVLAELVRKGWLTPAASPSKGPPPRLPVMSFESAHGRAGRGSGRSLIYVDSSVVLAHLLAEKRAPPASLWEEPLVSSRLLVYEVWNRIHAHDFGKSHGDAARAALQKIAFLELASPVLARALEPFPSAPRTLDALHLASIEFLRGQGRNPRLATYDSRLSKVARQMKIPLWQP